MIKYLMGLLLMFGLVNLTQAQTTNECLIPGQPYVCEYLGDSKFKCDLTKSETGKEEFNKEEDMTKEKEPLDEDFYNSEENGVKDDTYKPEKESDEGIMEENNDHVKDDQLKNDPAMRKEEEDQNEMRY